MPKISTATGATNGLPEPDAVEPDAVEPEAVESEAEYVTVLTAEVDGTAVHPDGLTDEEVAAIVAAEEGKA